MRISDRKMAGLRIEWIGRWHRRAAGLALAVALPCADAQPSQRCLRVTATPFAAIHLGRERDEVRRGTAYFSDGWDFPREARGEAVAHSGLCTPADTAG